MSDSTSEERLQEFLVSTCFQRPPKHAVDLAKAAWDEQEKTIKQLEKSLYLSGVEYGKLEARCKELEAITKAVAHIGVDFGFGEYEIEQKHIDKARELLTQQD